MENWKKEQVTLWHPDWLLGRRCHRGAQVQELHREIIFLDIDGVQMATGLGQESFHGLDRVGNVHYMSHFSLHTNFIIENAEFQIGPKGRFGLLQDHLTLDGIQDAEGSFEMHDSSIPLKAHDGVDNGKIVS